MIFQRQWHFTWDFATHQIKLASGELNEQMKSKLARRRIFIGLTLKNKTRCAEELYAKVLSYSSFFSSSCCERSMCFSHHFVQSCTCTVLLLCCNCCSSRRIKKHNSFLLQPNYFAVLIYLAFCHWKVVLPNAHKQVKQPSTKQIKERFKRMCLILKFHKWDFFLLLEDYSLNLYVARFLFIVLWSIFNLHVCKVIRSEAKS